MLYLYSAVFILPMKFDIITIFPDIFDSYFSESLLVKANEKGLIDLKVHNLRDWSGSPHKTVDGAPYGGGGGMVLKVEPIYRAVEEIREEGKRSKVILFSPRGKKFNQKKAGEYASLDQLIMICGRYEGIDERVKSLVADEVVSLGNFVLMGGEIPAMAVVESVSRLLKGVLGNENFLEERIREGGIVEYPQYTRPEEFKGKKVPSVLLSGNHGKIEKWREKKKKIIG